MEDFKRNIGLNALKTVAGLVIIYLLSNVAGSIFDVVVNESNRDPSTKMALGVVIRCVYLVRGGFDLLIYLMFSQEYRNAFRSVILNMRCCCDRQVTSPVIQIL